MAEVLGDVEGPQKDAATAGQRELPPELPAQEGQGVRGHLRIDDFEQETEEDQQHSEGPRYFMNGCKVWRKLSMIVVLTYVVASLIAFTSVKMKASPNSENIIEKNREHCKNLKELQFLGQLCHVPFGDERKCFLGHITDDGSVKMHLTDVVVPGSKCEPKTDMAEDDRERSLHHDDYVNRPRKVYWVAETCWGGLALADGYAVIVNQSGSGMTVNNCYFTDASIYEGTMITSQHHASLVGAGWMSYRLHAPSHKECCDDWFFTAVIGYKSCGPCSA